MENRQALKNKNSENKNGNNEGLNFNKHLMNVYSSYFPILPDFLSSQPPHPTFYGSLFNKILPLTLFGCSQSKLFFFLIFQAKMDYRVFVFAFRERERKHKFKNKCTSTGSMSRGRGRESRSQDMVTPWIRFEGSMASPQSHKNEKLTLHIFHPDYLPLF